jgi:hypothetical protein
MEARLRRSRSTPLTDYSVSDDFLDAYPTE